MSLASLSTGGTEAGSAELMELLRELLDDPRSRRVRQNRKVPIDTHVSDYRAYLQTKGDGAKHVRDTVQRARKLMAAAGTQFCDDLCSSAIARGLDALKLPFGPSSRTRGPATLNAYVHSLESFVAWMVADRRLREDPIDFLPSFDPQSDLRRERRALSDDEADRLLAAAVKGPVCRGMAGYERAMLYTVLLNTGLRVSEAASLTRASFDLEADPPTVTVEARYSKRGRRDVLPIRRDLAAGVEAYLSPRSKTERLFAVPPSGNACKMLRSDLLAAGVTYRLKGKYADLHAQRHTFVTRLCRHGANVKAAQELARHGDARLTLKVYAHLETGDKVVALEKMPALMRGHEVPVSHVEGPQKTEASDKWSDGESNPDLLNAIQPSKPTLPELPNLSAPEPRSGSPTRRGSLMREGSTDACTQPPLSATPDRRRRGHQPHRAGDQLPGPPRPGE